MPPTVIYGKEQCPHTKRAREAHPDAIFHDVAEDSVKMEEMLKFSGGVRRVPVLVMNGKAQVGFNRGS